jgi:hypothetical protein
MRHDSGLKDKIETARKQYGQQCLQTAKLKIKEQREPYLKEAGKYLDQKEIEAVLPPPTWKTVFEKNYTGIGFTGGVSNQGGIYIAKNGEDYKYGDRITVIGKNAQVWHEGNWQNLSNGKFVNINKSNNVGSSMGARAPQGEEIKIIVERML